MIRKTVASAAVLVADGHAEAASVRNGSTVLDFGKNSDGSQSTSDPPGVCQMVRPSPASSVDFAASVRLG